MNTFLNYFGATLLATFISCDICADSLPSAESLFEKHVLASYGDDGLHKYTSMTIEHDALMQEYNVSVPATFKRKSPSFYHSEATFLGQPQESGCIPEFCWENANSGLEIIEGVELKRWLEHNDYHRWENMNKYAESMETLELSEWGGEPAFKVKVIDQFGKENFYYFSKDRGFLIGTELTVADLGGFEPREITYKEFKQFGPFTLPAITTEVRPSITRVITIKSISFEEIPDSFFDIPDYVKKFISQNN